MMPQQSDLTTTTYDPTATSTIFEKSRPGTGICGELTVLVGRDVP